MKECSRCHKLHDRPQRYCAACHAAYMREWRKEHPLSEDARKRDIARSHANVGKRRGQIKQNPCEVCGERDSQMHHPDHELPRLVVWLCRPCHLAWHAHWRIQALALWRRWFTANKRSEAA